MKIAYLTAYFLPFRSAGSERALSYINAISRQDKSELILFYPIFIGEDIPPIQLKKLQKSHNINLVPVNIGLKRGPDNILYRTIKETITSIKLLHASKMHTNNKLIISTPFFPLLFLAPLFYKKDKIILEIRDATWSYFNNNLFRSFITMLSHFFIKRYQSAVTVTKHQYEMLPKKIKKNSYICENGISHKRHEDIKRAITFPEKTDFARLYYCGTLGNGQNIISVVKIFNKFSNLKIRLRGEGPQKKLINDYINLNGIQNIEILNYDDFSEVLNDYNWTNFLFVSLDSRFFSAIPSKIYEYLSTGKKIICFCSENSAIRSIEDKNLYFFNTPDNLNSEEIIFLEQLLIKNDQDLLFKSADITNKNAYIREKSIKNFLDKIS